jgi:hypothetical protein
LVGRSMKVPQDAQKISMVSICIIIIIIIIIITSSLCGCMLRCYYVVH